ncbi:MAG: hypothetical protein RBS05_21495 [Zoogloea oleivorans]|jgi:hypothetical protein|uniref:hypothetical protein n=1 Tax=Zoogloea oleivorans TaxID=1552750 RepID=UPI002A358E34|nr:hypothetical protein [Zoogloea oleivorans]MDY0038488.1 hypothetical protein [Zoogloea oleivorans]
MNLKEEMMKQWLKMTPAQRKRAMRGESSDDADGATLKIRDGGLVRGPGTGTSDSIPAKVPDGSYIMPADSTARLTPDLLEKMTGAGSRPSGDAARGKAKDVPVNLSNGEYHIPPDQVRNVGAQVLDSIKNATHVPAAVQGEQSALSRLGAGAAGFMRDMGDAWAADNAQFEAGNPGFMARAGRAINPLTGLGSAIGAARTAAQDGDLAGVGVAALGGVPAFGVMRAPVKGVAGMVSPGVDAARSAATIGANTAVNVAGDYYDGSRLPDPVQKAAGAPPPDRSIFRLAEGFRPDAEMPRQGFADGGLVDDEKRRNVPVPQPTHGPQPAPDAKIQSPVARIQAEARERRDAERAANPGGPYTDINGFRTGGASAQARTNSVPAAQLGQPEPSPNAGVGWSAAGNALKTAGNAVSDALTHSSDRAAMEQRQAARDETRRAAWRFGFMPQTPSRDVGVNLGFKQSTLQDFEREYGVNNISSQPAGSGGAEVGRIAPTATNTSVPGVMRYDRPGESPLFTNVPSGDMPGSNASRTTDSPARVDQLMQNLSSGNSALARRMSSPSASAIWAETARIQQNRRDGRPDNWQRTPEGDAAQQRAADMQSANYRMREAIEKAETARFFGRGAEARQHMQAAQMYAGILAAYNQLGSAERQTAMQQSGETARTKDTNSVSRDANEAARWAKQQQFGLDERKFDSEENVREMELRNREQAENLFQRMLNAESPEEQFKLRSALREYRGQGVAEENARASEAGARSSLVREVMKEYSREREEGRTNLPFNAWANPYMRQAGMGSTINEEDVLKDAQDALAQGKPKDEINKMLAAMGIERRV